MVGNGANRRIRRLTSVEIDAYSHLRPDLARRVVLIEIGYLPGRYLGITLGRFVFVAKMMPANGTDPLLAHELVHVRQWTELGVVGFIYRYLRDFFAGLRRYRRWHLAYRHIEAEEEARRVVEAWSQQPPPGSLPGSPR